MVQWHNQKLIIAAHPPLFLLNIGTRNKQYTNDGLISLFNFLYGSIPPSESSCSEVTLRKNFLLFTSRSQSDPS